MGRDQALLHHHLAPTLRFYRWARPTLSLGRFQPAASLPLAEWQQRGTDLVRRATGGKAIYHDRELTYALCLPERGRLGSVPESRMLRSGPGAAMEGIHRALADELGRQASAPVGLRGDAPLASDRSGSGWCFEDSSPLDLEIGRRKLLGSAARRKHGWILIHGSLIVQAPPAHAEIGALGFEPDQDGLCAALEGLLEMDFRPGEWSAEELDTAASCAPRYQQRDWVFRL